MKHLIIVSVLLLTAWSINGQTYSSLRPSWAKATPNPPSGANYFFSSGVGEGRNEDEAYDRAWADALQKSLHELGAIGITQQDIDAVKTQGIDAVISFNKMKRRSLCKTEFIRKPDGSGGKQYILIQVQLNVHRTDDFYIIDPQHICSDPAFEKELKKYNRQITGDYGASLHAGRVFIPGMAQIYKGSHRKGGLMIAGETVFIGGIIVSEVLRSSWDTKIASTHNNSLKQDYIHKAQFSETVRNVAMGGAVIVYVCSFFDGIFAKGKPNKNLSAVILPYATPYGGGITLNLTLTNKSK
jgi:hypothetical protein